LAPTRRLLVADRHHLRPPAGDVEPLLEQPRQLGRVQLTPAFAVERSDPFRPRPARPFPHRLVADPRDAAALLLHRHAASIHASRRSIGGGPPPTVPLPPCRVTPAPAPPPACPPARPARGSASSAQSA